MKQLIDTHTYFGSNRQFTVDIKPERHRKLQEKIIESHGYSPKFLLMAYSTEGNFLLPGIISDNPDLFLGGILQFNPNRSFEKIFEYTSPVELEKIIKSGLIVGLKLHTSATKIRVDCEDLDEFSRLAIDHEIPMVFHCAATGQDFSHPDYFRRLKDRHPDLRIVCAHYGGLYEEYIPQYVKLVDEFPDVYLNTAGLSGEIRRWDFDADPPSLFYKQNPERWSDLFLDSIVGIEDKVLFGSDYPELHFTLNPIDKTDRKIQQKVLYKNPVNAFGLDDM